MIYQLLLTYDSAELNILYSPTDRGYLPDPILHTCPLAEHGISELDVWIGDHPADLATGMKEIEEVSPLTVEEFSHLVIDKKEKACFDITLSH